MRLDSRIGVRLVTPWSDAIHSRAYTRMRAAACLRRVRGRGSPGHRALARALSTTARGVTPAEERSWSERIESRREELGTRESPARSFEQGLPDHISGGALYVSMAPVHAAFLMRLVRELNPAQSIELGTGLGISTAYQAAALELNGSGAIDTVDGSAEWMEVATESLGSLGLGGRVRTHVGPIEAILAEPALAPAPAQYALIDAEHTKEATLAYWDGLLPHLAGDAVVVVDDIPWTRDLRGAWRTIAAHPRVATGLTLGRIGIAVLAV